jgi:hypothetical protein
MKDEKDISGLYEASGLKEIFEKVEEKENFWDGVETDFWENEEKENFNKTIKQIELIDNNLTINKKNYYDEVEKKMEGISNEISKDIFEDDFKEFKKDEPKENEIDPFWLT